MARRVGLLLVISLLMISSLASAATEAAKVEGSISVPDGLELDGSVNGTLAEGAVHLRTSADGLQGASLEASSLSVHYAYKRGVQTDARSGEPAYRHNYEWGREEVTLSDVLGNITPFGDTPEFLVMTNGSSPRIQATGLGAASAESVQDTYLTRVGNSDDYVTLDPDAGQGFWYHIDGPWAATTGFDAVSVQGSFSVFVNNATLQVDRSDRGEWSHWTGTRAQPGTAPGTEQVETRVTVLEVTNGTLWLSAGDDVGLYGPALEMAVEGRVTSSVASGALRGEGAQFVFDSSTLALRGSGTLDLRSQPRGGSTQGPQGSSSSHGVPLSAVLDGRFEVEERPGVEVREATEPGRVWEERVSWLPWIGLAVALGAIAVAGRDRALAWYTEQKASRRREREQRWLSTGDKAFEAREFEAALSWYRRVVEAYPNSLEGWNSLAACFEELERFDQASDAYERAAGMMDGDASLMAQAGACAWRAGSEERAVELVVPAARQEPDVVARQLDRLALEGLLEHPEVRKVLGREESGAGTSASYV